VQHPRQEVGARARQEQRDHDLDGVGETQRGEVPHERRHAERRRLPVERQRESQAVVGIPQGQLTVVDLIPRQRGPRDHLGDLVGALRVVDHHSRLPGQPVARQEVERPEREAVHERREHHRHRRRGHHQHPDGVRAEFPEHPRSIGLAGHRVGRTGGISIGRTGSGGGGNGRHRPARRPPSARPHRPKHPPITFGCGRSRPLRARRHRHCPTVRVGAPGPRRRVGRATACRAAPFPPPACARARPAEGSDEGPGSAQCRQI
jgi:hypothetical protein